jgi:hypothetical protein
MITCYLRYIIDPFKLREFEHYGYFLPSEGANNVALAMFTFPSMALTRRIAPSRFKIRNARPLSSTRKRHAASSATSAAFSVRSLSDGAQPFRATPFHVPFCRLQRFL